MVQTRSNKKYIEPIHEYHEDSHDEDNHDEVQNSKKKVPNKYYIKKQENVKLWIVFLGICIIMNYKILNLENQIKNNIMYDNSIYEQINIEPTKFKSPKLIISVNHTEIIYTNLHNYDEALQFYINSKQNHVVYEYNKIHEEGLTQVYILKIIKKEFHNDNLFNQIQNNITQNFKILKDKINSLKFLF